MKTFAYLADGRKLHSIDDHANDGGLAYIGTSVFNIGRGNYTSFESTSFSAGRIVRSGNGTYAVQYHITDHLGSVRAVLNQNMAILEQNDYYPFGLRHPNSALKTTANHYRYNGKEEIAADATSDYGARQYSAVFCQWMQVDPLAEKYYSWSPYNFCVGNPQKYIDPNGKEIWIHTRHGDLQYVDGALYNKDGSSYEGKITNYCQKVISAISELNKTDEGKSLVTELQNSNNKFTIKRGNNKFEPNSKVKAGANLSEVKSVTGNADGSTGSGGTIYWNTNSTSGGLNLNGSTHRPAYIGLGHEMGHASDSNQGLLHFSSDYTNSSTGATYSSTHNGLLKSEWRAVYRENLIRSQAGIPLRTHYGYDISTGVPCPIGPRLLNPLNLPINY